ncbi:MAG: sialate O-acetylesterase [Lachnospiraceae bacterium]|nr:sialate O-acetylesterase [Lachnospiraceae bacterium]
MRKNIHCAAVFSDHCVLQRKKEIRVWGTASHGTEIKVVLNGAAAKTVTRGSSWEVTLPAMEAGGPYVLEVVSEGKVYQHFEDVMIGEVWLAGGQSNMEYMLKQDADGAAALARMADSDVRYYQVQQVPFIDDYFYRVEQENHWMLPDDEEKDTWSAVGFYFAERLAKELEVTVGIIGCNWGGTSASAWQDKDSILSHEDTKIYWEEYEKLLETQNPSEYEKERIAYFDYQADWQPRMDAYYAANPTSTWEEALAAVGEAKWPGPMGPKHEFRPAGLYECMLQRVVPYTLGGVIYYQGESDDHRPEAYYNLFGSMISVWRREFRDAELPFLCVQLPIHHYDGDTVMDKWCAIREAQMRLHREGVVTGIAVALECGEYNNIHPVHKTEVARRLAIQALYHVFGIGSEEEVYGPIFRTLAVNGSELLVSFYHAEHGFTVKGKEIKNFEVAGPDGKFVPAKAEVRGSSVVLSSETVSVPVAARYMWIDYAEVTLFGANGLPVAPFITLPQ